MFTRPRPPGPLTRQQEQKLEALGFTVGFNAVSQFNSPSRASLYIWLPTHYRDATSNTMYTAEFTRLDGTSEVSTFDDPISAAVFLLTCV